MKTITFGLLGISLSSMAMAQKSAVLETLSKYNIDAVVLDPNLKSNSESYYYDLNITSAAGDQKKVFVSHYDPAQKGDDRWQLVSVNGQAPSSTDRKTFRKTVTPQPKLKADDNTFKVEKDEGGYLEISYLYDPASLVSDNKYLKDCKVNLVVNSQTGRLERAEVVNQKELKVKILKLTSLNVATYYTYLENDKKYLVEKENVAMVVKMLGQEVPSSAVNEYRYKLN